MRTFKVTLTEEELKAIINHHCYGAFDYTVERSSRIHELTKKLNKNVELTETTEEQQTEITEEQIKDNASAVSGW